MELLRELEDLMLLLAGALPGDGSHAARGAGAGGQCQHALIDTGEGSASPQAACPHWPGLAGRGRGTSWRTLQCIRVNCPQKSSVFPDR